ncbi:hypothetical protein D9615_006689 [Tricholomella constricta]|uniref:Uncharacterized protein n=1 Tax=Tricholomella constricta TaxID=117010 RepID=A0A8H5M1Y7_9AGAR|nr:hypothetical protein D9615_006689 [Tricholomella constricta]
MLFSLSGAGPGACIGSLVKLIIQGLIMTGASTLSILYSLAQTQLELFYSQITNPDFDTKLVPIDKVIDKRNFIYCQTTSSPLDIASIITSTASDFANGDASPQLSNPPSTL